MQQVARGYKGLGLLVDLNSDRMLSILIIAAALAAVGWVGVEYGANFIAEDTGYSLTTTL